MQIVLEGQRLVAVRDVFTVGNNEQNTAQHQALKAKHEAVALRLIAEDQRVSFILNNKGESPLYMAAEAGNVALEKETLQGPDAWFEGKSVVDAAIKSKETDILDLLLEKDKDLIDSREEEGRSLLLYAAYVGYEEGVRYLLEIFGRSRAVAYVRDQDGFFPIHTACRKGHTATLRMILQFCPDTIELLNLKGQNILHAAAESGKNEVVKYLLRNRKYGKLINKNDNAGNTPLHLTAMYWHPRVVYTLTRDERISLGDLNKEGFTALDAAEGYLESNPTFRERLTWMALVCTGTPRALKPMALGPFPSSMAQEVAVRESETAALQTQERPTAKKYRDRVNTLLLLAILVATMAFSAAFKAPRGSNGVGSRYKQGAFQIFVVSNTMAMYSAVLTTVALLWAQLGDLNSILTVFKFVLPLLGFALISMCMAFVAGLLVVTGHHHWLPVFLFVSGGVLFVVMPLLVIPFVCPYTSSPLLFRYVLRDPFCHLMLTVWNDIDDDDDLE